MLGEGTGRGSPFRCHFSDELGRESAVGDFSVALPDKVVWRCTFCCQLKLMSYPELLLDVAQAEVRRVAVQSSTFCLCLFALRALLYAISYGAVLSASGVTTGGS